MPHVPRVPGSPPLVAAIEAGGTKFVCAVGTGPGEGILARQRFDTGSDPARLLDTIAAWFVAQQEVWGRIAALGVASFGPVDLDERSPTHGFITTTPKPGWQNADLLGSLRRALPRIPFGFDTDVNGAALGEGRWGAARELNDFLYVTVGTGIGGGAVAGGRVVHGLVHPEMGHIQMPRVPGDEFQGACPFHGRCWEGLCSGPAIAARAGIPAEDLPPDHPAWDATIRSMGHALATLTCVLSPRRIVLGGSVRKGGRLGEERFFAGVRRAFRETLAGYVLSPALDEHGINTFIVPPALGDDAGVCGAIALAHDAAGWRPSPTP
jgi:fructokinase